jgi:hypothetical protein
VSKVLSAVLRYPRALPSRYDEINSPGYSGEGDMGAGHFTQVVWKESTLVGAAFNGSYVTANYKAAGNFQGAYDENVEAECSGDVSELYEETKTAVDSAEQVIGVFEENAEDLGMLGDFME